MDVSTGGKSQVLNFDDEDMDVGGLTEVQRDRFCHRMEKSVVLIYLEGNEDRFGGHGVLISIDGVIATAAHLFEDMDTRSKIVVKVHNRKHPKWFIAKIVRLQKIRDIALLKIEDDGARKHKFKYTELANELRIGQDVHMVASNDGKGFGYSNGTVAFESRLKRNIAPAPKFSSPGTVLVQCHNLHGIPGVSGAPVFNSRGRVIGIYSFSYCRMDFLVHFTHLSKLFSHLERGSPSSSTSSSSGGSQKQRKRKRGRGRRRTQVA